MLAGALKRNGVLASIDLGCNPIGDDGVAFWFHELQGGKARPGAGTSAPGLGSPPGCHICTRTGLSSGLRHSHGDLVLSAANQPPSPPVANERSHARADLRARTAAAHVPKTAVLILKAVPIIEKGWR